MGATLLTIALALAAGLGPHASDHAPGLYGFSAGERTLYRIDPAQGRTPSTPIGRIAPIAANADLAMLTDAGDGQGYTIDRRANVLHTVRLSDAAVVASVPLDMNVWVTRRGLARSPEGVLYALLPGMDLRTIDPATGATAIVGPVSGATMIEALAFSPDGTLFALGSAGNKFSNALYRIDTTTAVATHIADLPVPDADVLTFAGGALYAADASGAAATLWRIDPATGDLVSQGTTGIATLNGLAAAQNR
ncbi:MAG: DUF6923 family protein [Phycisphaerales bacterium JB060]